MNAKSSLALLLCLAMTSSSPLFAQPKKANYDEALVNMGELPPLLLKTDGRAVTASEWESHRSDLVKVLSEHQFGFLPTDSCTITFEKVESGLMYDGNTLREQYVVHLATEHASLDVELALFLPTKQTRSGGFLGLNFQGNHASVTDPAMRIPTSWMRENPNAGVVDHRATEKGRGAEKDRWPIREINERGFFVATAYYGDIDPDFDDGFQNGVHSLFPEFRSTDEHTNRWGSIGGWAWGLSRLLDVLTQHDAVDASRVAVIGHSRLGKTALWAGATDPRFALVISNNSGCGGAAIERRYFGETVAIINKAFPHWFCGNFRRFDDNESEMPHDAHTLVASIAPRPVYIASATKDEWADPKGEYLSGYYASAVYELLGYKGLESETKPAPGISVGDRVGYHVREGAHDILPEDWTHFMNFADRHWK
ncbi:alpha/beta hydrolase family protein [Pirellulaceae bacterium SH449]